jgi:flagellar biosynthesis/type III secretory pathway protein FliH
MVKLPWVERGVMNMSDATSPAAMSAWKAPDLNALGADEGVEPVLDEQARQAIVNEAYAEGYAKGHEAGETAGNALTADRANAFLALLDGIDQPLIEMDQHLVEEVAELAAVIAAEIARAMIIMEPEKLYEHIFHLTKDLAAQQDPFKIFLNPEDKVLVAAYISELPDGHPVGNWSLFEEISIQRGDVRIQASDSSIEAKLTSTAVNAVRDAMLHEHES